MVVLLLNSATPGERGYLARWLLEVHPGLFVGKISTRVRETLWKTLRKQPRHLGILMVYAAANEQGYNIRAEGNLAARVCDFDGLLLLARKTVTTTDLLSDDT